jgi:DNA-binding NarL/FixJ family response regulator
MRIFLIDDSLAFLKVAARFLREGLRDEVMIVGQETDCETALAQVAEMRPNIILLDLNMPGLNGLDAIPLLRARLPQARIIALTLLEANGYQTAALDAGADAFVSKSNMGNGLLPVIRQLMSLRWEAATGGWAC